MLAAVWALAPAGCAAGTGPVQSPEGTAFGQRLLRVLEDAAEENPLLRLEEGGGDCG